MGCLASYSIISRREPVISQNQIRLVLCEEISDPIGYILCGMVPACYGINSIRSAFFIMILFPQNKDETPLPLIYEGFNLQCVYF